MMDGKTALVASPTAIWFGHAPVEGPSPTGQRPGIPTAGDRHFAVPEPPFGLWIGAHRGRIAGRKSNAPSALCRSSCAFQFGPGCPQWPPCFGHVVDTPPFPTADQSNRAPKSALFSSFYLVGASGIEPPTPTVSR